MVVNGPDVNAINLMLIEHAALGLISPRLEEAVRGLLADRLDVETELLLRARRCEAPTRRPLRSVA